MASAVQDAEGQPPSLGDVIERIGLGLAQFRTGVLGGCVWLADGSELLLIGTVTRAVSQEWHMHAWQRGMVVSVVFVGILIGNAISGPMGDRLGRRLPILISYTGIALFSVWSAMAQGFHQLAAIRIFVGASFGIGQPAFNALCTEVTPAYWRICMNSLTSSLFIVGELYSALLVWYDDPQMHELDWRWLLLMGAIPSAVMLIFSYFFLHQSPSYLAIHGEYDQAVQVLKSMRHDNGADHVNVEFKPLPPRAPSTPLEAIMAPMRVIFSVRMLFSTLVVIYSCYTLNMVYYGSLYAFPQVVTDVDMGSSPAMSLILGVLWEFPGILLAVACGTYFARKPVMVGYLFAVSVSLIAFAFGAKAQITDHSAHWIYHGLMHAGYMGIKCFSVVGFVAVYQYSTEIYPTVARTTGTAACVAGGRLGGMVAPLIFETLLDRTGSFEAFFYFMGVLCIVNLVLVVLLPFETSGKALDDIHDDDETKPLVAAH